MAAIARLSECDDIHLDSCVTPGAIVIPVALVLSDPHSADDFNRAVSVGYAAGLSLGKAVGGVKALACGVWPTLLAAPVMAAATASCLRRHDAAKLAHSIALALAGSSGRVGRPSGTATGRWFVLAEAIMKGVRAAEAAEQGFTGDLELTSQSWLSGQSGHDAIDMTPFDLPPTICDVGFKPFPIARQALNAVLAFQALLSNGLDLSKLESLEVLVPDQNLALLTRAVADADRLSRLSNLSFQLACAAHAPGLLDDPERHRVAGASGRGRKLFRKLCFEDGDWRRE
jgi:2-methylcitrate dehydratase PrpD